MTRTPRLAAAVLLLVLTGCSGEPRTDPDDDRPADPAQIRDGLAALYAGDHPGPRETADGDCFARALTESTSPDQLRDDGVLDGSYDVVPELPVLSEEMAQAWADAQFACTDFVEESTRAQVNATEGRIDTEVYDACLRAELTEGELRAAVVDSLTGHWSGAALGKLGRAQTECADEAASGRRR